MKTHKKNDSPGESVHLFLVLLSLFLSAGYAAALVAIAVILPFLALFGLLG